MKLFLKILFFLLATGADISTIALGGIGSVKNFSVSYQASKLTLASKTTVIAEEAVETSTSLIKIGTKFSKHSLERLAQRGVTQDMAELAINKGQKFYDPLNKSINYVLSNGFASGKSLLVGTNIVTGEVTTVIRSSKNLINIRFIPIK
jgi:hypothetical protein